MECYCTRCGVFLDSTDFIYDESGDPICTDCFSIIFNKREPRMKSIEELKAEDELDKFLEQQFTHTKELGIKQLKEWGVQKWNSYRKDNFEKFPLLESENLEGLDLSKIDLSNANLKGANLFQANLMLSNLTEANLDEAKLYQAKLNSANVSKAKIREAILINASIVGADLEETELCGSNLRRADLLNVNLKNTDLTNVELSGAQLVGTKMIDTVLKGAELDFADLSYCNCRGVDFSNSSFTGAVLERLTIMDSIFKNATAEYIFVDRERKNKIIFTHEHEFEEFLKTLDFYGNAQKAQLPSVFLSYAWADHQPVLAIDQWLREKGFQVILDDRDFFAGQNIRNEILRCIQQADVIVCFVSKNSKDRAYPKLEREIADNLRLEGKAEAVYFKLDNTSTDIEHEHRLYIPGYQLTFDDSCEKLFQAIVKYSKISRPFNIKPFIEAGKNWTKILRSE